MKQHDPSQCLLSFDGVPISGYADGTFIEVEANDDSFTLQIGSDGEATRSRSQNRSGVLTLTLMQGSASNDFLSGMLLSDRINGDGVGALQMADNLGTTLVLAQNAWVKRSPNVRRSKESDTVEWVFESDRMDVFVGGQTA